MAYTGAHINLLLAAKKQKLLRSWLSAAFAARHALVPPAPPADVAATLGCSAEDAAAVFAALVAVAKAALKHGDAEAAREVLAAAEAPAVDERLSGALVDLAGACLPEWRAAAALSRPGLPRLVDFAHRAGAADAAADDRAAATCRVDLHLAGGGAAGATRTVGIELPPQALLSLVDGFQKIAEQLDTVVQKQ